MSIAVAVQSRGRIVLAADTKRTFGSGAIPEDNLVDVKVRKVGSAYLAATGWGIYANILDDYLSRSRRATLTNQQAIFSFFRVFWRDLHDRYSFVSDQRPDDDSPFGDLDASFLVINANGIFAVACDMSVTRFAQYYAIGSGAGYALGAVHALYEPNADPAQIATRAVEAAIALDLYCGGEITVDSVAARGTSRTRKTRKKR